MYAKRQNWFQNCDYFEGEKTTVIMKSRQNTFDFNYNKEIWTNIMCTPT